MALTKGQRDREFKGTGRPPTARTMVTSTSSRSSIICRQRSYAICPSFVRLSLRVVRLSNRAPIRSSKRTMRVHAQCNRRGGKASRLHGKNKRVDITDIGWLAWKFGSRLDIRSISIALKLSRSHPCLCARAQTAQGTYQKSCAVGRRTISLISTSAGCSIA